MHKNENRDMREKLEEESKYLKLKFADPEKEEHEKIVGIQIKEYEQLIRENERMKTVIESARTIHNLRKEGDD